MKGIYRSKGFVVFEKGSFMFNYVAGRADYEGFKTYKTKIVFIGNNIKHMEENVKRSLIGCEL